MSEHNDPDHEIAKRLGRLGVSEVQPKHIRMVGAYFLIAAVASVGYNIHLWQNDELSPKMMYLSPSLSLLGTWWLIDARALAEGTRRNQKQILWACIGVGFAVAMAIIHELTGSFF